MKHQHHESAVAVETLPDEAVVWSELRAELGKMPNIDVQAKIKNVEHLLMFTKNGARLENFPKFKEYPSRAQELIRQLIEIQKAH